ncbi:MAG: DUF3325 domain-containing protein [Thalassotalea sp.]|nr:DUF3325 domain-containing protein [Thalassotalea sp.]
MLSVTSFSEVISFLCLILAIALLSIGVGKHFKDCFKKPIKERQQRMIRGLGWALLMLSLAVVNPLPINYVIWLTQLSLIILIQAVVLSRFQTIRKKPHLKLGRNPSR